MRTKRGKWFAMFLIADLCLGGLEACAVTVVGYVGRDLHDSKQTNANATKLSPKQNNNPKKDDRHAR